MLDNAIKIYTDSVRQDEGTSVEIATTKQKTVGPGKVLFCTDPVEDSRYNTSSGSAMDDAVIEFARLWGVETGWRLYKDPPDDRDTYCLNRLKDPGEDLRQKFTAWASDWQRSGMKDLREFFKQRLAEVFQIDMCSMELEVPIEPSEYERLQSEARQEADRIIEDAEYQARQIQLDAETEREKTLEEAKAEHRKANLMTQDAIAMQLMASQSFSETQSKLDSKRAELDRQRTEDQTALDQKRAKLNEWENKLHDREIELRKRELDLINSFHQTGGAQTQPTVQPAWPMSQAPQPVITPAPAQAPVQNAQEAANPAQEAPPAPEPIPEPIKPETPVKTALKPSDSDAPTGQTEQDPAPRSDTPASPVPDDKPSHELEDEDPVPAPANKPDSTTGVAKNQTPAILKKPVPEPDAAPAGDGSDGQIQAQSDRANNDTPNDTGETPAEEPESESESESESEDEPASDGSDNQDQTQPIKPDGGESDSPGSKPLEEPEIEPGDPAGDNPGGQNQTDPLEPDGAASGITETPAADPAEMSEPKSQTGPAGGESNNQSGNGGTPENPEPAHPENPEAKTGDARGESDESDGSANNKPADPTPASPDETESEPDPDSESEPEPDDQSNNIDTPVDQTQGQSDDGTSDSPENQHQADAETPDNPPVGRAAPAQSESPASGAPAEKPVDDPKPDDGLDKDEPNDDPDEDEILAYMPHLDEDLDDPENEKYANAMNTGGAANTQPHAKEPESTPEQEPSDDELQQAIEDDQNTPVQVAYSDANIMSLKYQLPDNWQTADSKTLVRYLLQVSPDHLLKAMSRKEMRTTFTWRQSASSMNSREVEWNLYDLYQMVCGGWEPDDSEHTKTKLIVYFLKKYATKPIRAPLPSGARNFNPFVYIMMLLTSGETLKDM